VGSVLDALASIARLLEDHGRDVLVQDEGASSASGHLRSRLGGTGGGLERVEVDGVRARHQ
jgi:hypothetical protein